MSEWKTVRLGDMLKTSSGGTPSKKNNDYYHNGNIPWILSGDISQGHITKANNFITQLGLDNSSAKFFPKGTVLVAMYGATVGQVGILDIEATTNQAICGIFPDNHFSTNYLFYFCKSQKEHLLNLAIGGAQPNISQEIIKNLQIPLPPLETQEQIATQLDKCTTIIAKYKQMLEKYDMLIKSRFIEMFGDPHNNTKYTYKNVGDFTTVTSGGTPDRKNIEYWKNGNIPWVKTTELQNNELTNVEEFITQKGLDESSAKMMPIGTLLIAMYGQGKTRGMTAYLGIEASTNQACACILPSKVINQKFLWYYFILSYDKLRDLAKGGNQPNLNGNMIKDFPVLMPPIEMQNEYVSFVQQIDKSKFAVQKSLEKAETLYKSLMQEYFG